MTERANQDDEHDWRYVEDDNAAFGHKCVKCALVVWDYELDLVGEALVCPGRSIHEESE